LEVLPVIEWARHSQNNPLQSAPRKCQLKFHERHLGAFSVESKPHLVVHSFGGFGSARNDARFGAGTTAEPSQSHPEREPEYDNEDNEDHLTSVALEHQESVKQDYGLTTTYDLPGN
jgi:hypothetical protein